MATADVWKTVVWERQNQMGIWCAYPGEVGQLLEQSSKKNLPAVQLGDADIGLKNYSVNLGKMAQVSEVTGTLSQVRRRCIPQDSAVANGVVWQWHGDRHGSWHSYDADVINYIEDAYKEGKSAVDLSENFPHCSYEIHFHKMQQRNKRTKYRRPIRRITVTPFPVTKCSLQGVDEENITYEALSAALDNVDCSGSDSCSDTSPTKRRGRKHFVQHVTDFWNKFKKQVDRDSDDASDNLVSSANKKQCVSDKSGDEFNTHDSNKSTCDADMDAGENSVHPIVCEPSVALVYGKPWNRRWAPDIPRSKLKPVPGVNPLPTQKKRGNASPNKVSNDSESVLDMYTETLTVLPTGDEEDKDCAICFEELCTGSPYDNDSTVVKLQQCRHIFHKACLKAMYENGPKNGCLQCPKCKTIHGVKCGIQPPGTMEFHVMPCSLPGHSNCKTIRIVYDIPPGIQGPEHPNPGGRYSARGFPRTCYLPDNEEGRRVLKLLIKAWERRLTFTVGTSATTGEENTVTWNEIHHKTEFGANTCGHGYPDPNYFENIIAELAAQGVTDST